MWIISMICCVFFGYTKERTKGLSMLEHLYNAVTTTKSQNRSTAYITYNCPSLHLFLSLPLSLNV